MFPRSLAAVLLLVAAPSSAATRSSSVAPEAQEIVRFRDGSQFIEATRLGFDGGLARVLLRWEDGRSTPALVGRHVVLELARDAEPERIAARVGLRLVRPLMARAGLWLAEDAGPADGLALAARLTDSRAQDPAIRSAFPDAHLPHSRTSWTPDDPQFPGQWFLERLGMIDAWQLARGDGSTSVVVIDTGCDGRHPDLVAKLDAGRDVIDGDDDPTPPAGEAGNAHGTACAGLIAASTNNRLGVAGACPECRLRCVRLLGGESTAVPLSADVDAFAFALDSGAAVVSNSWGFTRAIPVPQALAVAVNEVFDHGRGGKGAVVVFAAGNEDREVRADELLGVRGVLGVSALTLYDETTSFSNSGSGVDLSAYAGTLTTDISGPDGDDPGDYTHAFGGTSSACPVVAGVAALVASAAPELRSEELVELLIETAKPAPFAVPDAAGHDPGYGYGIVAPVPALRKALGLDVADAGAPLADAGSEPGGGGDLPKSCGCSGASAVGLALIPLLLRRRRS
jgi:hypothetical protein